MEITRYHVHTDTKDDWFAEGELVQAVLLYQRHCNEQAGTVRLYEQVYLNEENLENDVMEREDALLHHDV